MKVPGEVEAARILTAYFDPDELYQADGGGSSEGRLGVTYEAQEPTGLEAQNRGAPVLLSNTRYLSDVAE